MLKRILIFAWVLVFTCWGAWGFCRKESNSEKFELFSGEKLRDISKHCNLYVRTVNETFLYLKDENGYKKDAKINTNVELELALSNLIIKNDYFKISSLDKEYYIYYEDVEPIDKLSVNDTRYKNYVLFNKSVVTSDNPKFYSDSGYVFEFNHSFTLPIIMRDDDKIYVEYSNNLYYLRDEDVVSEIDSKNTDEVSADRVRTLVYHRIYDPETEKCDQVICHKEKDFDSQMKYLSENNYFSLTMKELELFLEGNLRIPQKSIVITIDDGTMDKRAVPILEKYKVNATLFLVTSRFKEQDYIDFTSDYLELHSHSHNMHWAGECAGYGSQGGGILCLPEERVLEDLKQSREILNGSTVFCYPFYDYDNRAIELLDKAGFTMAFAGELGTGGYSYVGTDKMQIPRLTLNAYTTLEDFKRYVT